MSAYLAVVNGTTVLVTESPGFGISSEPLANLLDPSFSATYSTRERVGRREDPLRAVDTPFSLPECPDQPGERVMALYGERLEAFEMFAAKQASLKARQDLALMIALMEEI